MKKYKEYEIIHNKKIAKDVYELVVKNNGDKIKSGQFYMLRVDDKFLARPISVCDSSEDKITFVYKIFGQGTKILSSMAGNISMLGPLGNGWTKVDKKKVVLVGGGVGTPAIYKLAQELRNSCELEVVLGFRNQEDSFYEENFKQLATKVHIASNDGTIGQKGNVVDVLKKLDFDYIYACGPNPMLKAIASNIDVQGQVSLEEHMACGIGICGGCPGSILKKIPNKKVCIDGPVFDIGSLDV